MEDLIKSAGLVIRGTSAAEKLYGYIGNDTLDGGTGDDYLYGCAGNDTYIFGKSYGQDIVLDDSKTETGTIDRIKFIDISKEEIEFGRTGNDLILTAGPDKLTVRNYFAGTTGQYKIEEIEFSDNKVERVEDLIKSAGLVIRGTSASETLCGYSENEKLYGLEGTDKLYGYSGNDILDGGTDDDYLYGDVGDDTYIFGKRYGHDTVLDDSKTENMFYKLFLILNQNIQLDNSKTETGTIDRIKLKDISKEEVELSRTANNLTLTAGSDKLTVQNYFAGTTGQYEIEEIEFSDNSVESLKELINSSGLVIKGTTAAETLYGYSGNDVLDGGTGDDYLYGDVGNDTYIFGKGYGKDTIKDNSGEELLKIDYSPAELVFKKSGNDLTIGFSEKSDGIKIQSWFSGTNNQIEKIETSTGDYITNTQVQLLIQAMAAFEKDNGMTWSEGLEKKSDDTKVILAQYWEPDNFLKK